MSSSAQLSLTSRATVMCIYMHGRVGVFKPWTLDKRIHDRPQFGIRPRVRNVYKTYQRSSKKVIVQTKEDNRNVRGSVKNTFVCVCVCANLAFCSVDLETIQVHSLRVKILHHGLAHV